MRQVAVTLNFEAAESLLGLIQGSNIPNEMRDYLAGALQTAIRDASAPDGGHVKPRYVGEHGEDKA